MFILNKVNELFINKLKEIVPQYQEEQFLLAVSGGRDSMVMAHLFLAHNLKFAIAHVNFHLRNEDSNRDMQLVQNWAAKHQVTCYVQEFDTYALLKESALSLEMMARELRYNWFATFTEYHYICTAHHAQDNIETLFLNLSRGTGYKGLNGIAVQRDNYLRPLLHISSNDMDKYAEDQKIEYRVDESNNENLFHRNKIRNQILPLFQEVNPQFQNVVQKNIEVFNQQYHFYKSEMRKKIEMCCVEQDNTLEISIEHLLRDEHGALILYEILSPRDYNATQIELIFNSLSQPSGKVYQSPSHTLVKDRTVLILVNSDLYNCTFSVIIENEDDFLKHGFEMTYFEGNDISSIKKDKNVFLIDAQNLEFPITIRNWKEGDYFYPFGMSFKKKLSNFFTDNKFNRIAKQQTKLLCIRDDIAWVVGHRTDNRFKVTKETTAFYKIRYNGR